MIINSNFLLVNGVWGTWATWSTCTDNCQGVQYTTRCCSKPQHGGTPCFGATANLRTCKKDGKSCAVVPGIISFFSFFIYLHGEGSKGKEAELRDRRDRRSRARTNSSDHKSFWLCVFVFMNSTGHKPSPAGTNTQIVFIS